MKLSQLAQLAFIVLAAIAVYLFVRTGIDAERRRACDSLCQLAPSYAASDRLAPDFELPSLGGGSVALRELRGKVVVLNFWTKHCRPCLEEMPSLAQLALTLRNRDDVVVVTVSTDETAEDVGATLAGVLGGEPPFMVLIDSDATVVTGKFGTELFPETWFIDPQGIIRARFDGVRDWSDALTMGFVESLRLPTTCPVQFDRRMPSAAFAMWCE